VAINDVLIVTAAVGFATLILFSEIGKQKQNKKGTYCPTYAGSNWNFAIMDARTAFISIIDIVLPMQACGPAMNDNMEKVELWEG